MSTYMQLIIEITTGDDLVLDPLKRDEEIVIVLGPTSTTSDGTAVGTDTVLAKVHSVAYIPEEALE